MECIDKDGSFPLAETWCAAFLYEARAVSSPKRSDNESSEAKRKYLERRCARYRVNKIKTILHLQQRLETGPQLGP